MPGETKEKPAQQETTEDPVEAKLAALRARRAERDAAAEREEKEREILSLELEERFEKELGGRLGEKFVVVQAGHRGPIVLKLGANVLHKQFNGTIDDNQKKGYGGKTGITEEACSKFVKPCVAYPDVKEFQSIVEELPGVLYRCAGQLAALYDADRAAARGKS